MKEIKDKEPSTTQASGVPLKRLVMCGGDKTPEFYKKFYDDNRIKLLQYDNLRKYFGKMVDEVLGLDYYNMAMDIYECDRICCEDITIKAKSFLCRLFNT